MNDCSFLLNSGVSVDTVRDQHFPGRETGKVFHWWSGISAEGASRDLRPLMSPLYHGYYKKQRGKQETGVCPRQNSLEHKKLKELNIHEFKGLFLAELVYETY